MWLWATAARADSALVVYAETLHTSGPAGTIRDGVVLVRDGKIAAVGPRGSVTPLKDAAVLRARVVTPGLIDTHTVAGLAGIYNVAADQDSDETTGPTQAALRALDGFNPREPLLGWLLQNGVTVVQSGPGEANPIGGLAGVFKTVGAPVDDVTLRFPSALIVTLGESPKGTYGAKGQAPSTRMGTAAIIRKAFVEAQAYQEQWARYERKRAAYALTQAEVAAGPAEGDTDAESDEETTPPEPPVRDLAKEALVLALERSLPTIITARREDDILTALRLGEEFGLDVQLADAAEAYLMADRLKVAGVHVHVGPVIERPGRPETMNISLEGPAILARRGIPVTFQSGYEGYVPRVHVVLFEAAVAAAYGFEFDRALAALTSEAARTLGIADRVGSIEVGKDGDLVLFNGDPFEYVTTVEAVVVDGVVAHHRTQAPDPRWRPLER